MAYNKMSLNASLVKNSVFHSAFIEKKKQIRLLFLYIASPRNRIYEEDN